MAVGKGRTRPLMVQGCRFRWRCEFNEPSEKFSVDYARNGTTWKPDKLVVRPENGPHRLLNVTWPACQGPVVIPRLVRACIEEAIQRGWLAELPVMTLEGFQVAAGPPTE